ncbi:MAG: 6-phosphogluconolactonase [Acidimicrobiales bacterium]|nr:6-phosphogluconolactonase [Acidimicrobiales bacterium]
MSDAPPRTRELAVVSDVAGEFAERIVEAFHCRSGERFCLALTGGAVAAECYERLATHGETQIDWWQVELFLADECAVDFEHADSHERLIRLMLLDRVGAAHLVYPLRDEGSRGAAADALAARALDVVHLDLGADGRLSSHFPGAAPAVGASVGASAEELVIRTVDPLGIAAHERFCLAWPVIERAGCVVVTAVGAGVAGAFAAVQAGLDVPGNRLRNDRVVWLADRAAAGA